MKDTPFTADRLLALYDRVAEAEDAIPRLRRFVLDLAVRGKLVEQDPNDEPAAELMKRIAKGTARLIAEGKIRRTKSQPLVGDDTAINPPNGWEFVSGNEVFFSRSGNSKLIKGQLHSEPSDNRFAGYSAAGQDVWLDHWEHEGIAVILSAVGARCGKAFLANGRWSAVANTHIVWLMPSITIPAYAMLHLNNEDYWIRSGGAQPFIKVNETLERPFPLPPLAEQQRIVAKVDELMALCDRLQAAWAGREAVRDRLIAATLTRLTAPETDARDFPAHARFALQTLPTLTTRPDQIKTLRQTILNLAVRGKLVEQDPTDEPAVELLKRIAKEKAHRRVTGEKRKEQELKRFDNLEAPFALPSGWLWVPMGELGETNVGLTYSPNDVAKVGTPVLRSSNIQNGKLDFEDLVRVGSQPKESAMVENGDLLICARNGSRALVGKVAIIEDLPERSAFGAFMAIFRSEVNRYLYTFISSPVFRSVIDEVNTTTINQITQNNLRSTLAPLPPLAEQHRIVARVDALMALCDQLESSLTTATTTRSRLLEALLHEALNGAPGDQAEAAA
jgi:type I restriction enzyme S subunit